MSRTAGTGDALDAPATEAEVGVVVDVDAVVDAAAVVGGSLEQEGRALVHDGDDRGRDAVARAQYGKESAALKNAREVEEEGSVDTGSGEGEDDVERRAEEAAAAVVVDSDGRDEREDVVMILLAEVCQPATKSGVDVYYREVPVPRLSSIYVREYLHT